MVLAAIGVLRFPDLYTRMHAAAKSASFGSVLTLIAVALFFSSWSVAVEVILIIAFIFLTAPVAAHMIGRAGYALGVPLWEKTVQNDLRDPQDPPALT